MQTACIDSWADDFAQIVKSATVRNGPAIEIRLGLGFARITPDPPPEDWARIELIYPEGVTRDNRDGVPRKRFCWRTQSAFNIQQELCGRIYGYKRALERAQERGPLR
jgi:hypothetical protein